MVKLMAMMYTDRDNTDPDYMGSLTFQVPFLFVLESNVSQAVQFLEYHLERKGLSC